MQRSVLLLLTFTLLLTACYNYDGPTRPKRELRKVAQTFTKPFEIPVEKKLSSQEYLMKMAEDIARTIPSSQVEILSDSIKVFFPDNIQFGPSGVMPVNDISPEMSKLARLIIKYDKTHVLLTGHTDKNGDESINRKISELRAQYIMDLLIAYKVSASRLSSWGLGSSSPLKNTSKGQNRRVEFIVLSTEEDEEKL